MYKWRFETYDQLVQTYNSWLSWWFALAWNDFYIWDANDISWVELWSISDIYSILDSITNSVTVTGNITLDWSHNKIVCDASSGNIIVTLPSAVWIEWKEYTVTRIDWSANTVTIQPQWWQTIYWSSSETLYQYETLVFSSDNINYL